MSQSIQLEAHRRQVSSKRAARQLRRDGRVPAVVYGGAAAPCFLSLSTKLLAPHLSQSTFFTHLVDLCFEGKTERVLPREVQYHPVTDQPLHLDFIRVTKDAHLTLEVPVEFTEEALSPGLKKGGVLNIVKHRLKISAPALEIPEKITLSVKGFDLGDSIYFDPTSLPSGVKFLGQKCVLATIISPSGLVEKKASEDSESAE